MALVLAEHPVKHPNYPNGDHYAVLDTDNEQVGYFTLDEIEKDIKEEGTIFIGSHSLAIKDTRLLTHKHEVIKRDSKSAILVYFIGRKVVIEFFETHNLGIVLYSDFKRDRVRDYLQPSTLNVGILGFKDASKIYPLVYSSWRHILERSYARINMETQRWYHDTHLDSSWLFFPNFLNWYSSQLNYTEVVLKILEIENTTFDVDKDILFKGNKCYSYKTCVLVPHILNVAMTFIQSNTTNLPCGLVKDKDGIATNPTFNGRFIRKSKSFNQANKLLDVDYYSSIAKQYEGIDKIPKEQWAAIGYCFLWFKEHKEAEIKRLAEYWYNYEYEGQIYHCITKECYDALMNWVVDIND